VVAVTNYYCVQQESFQPLQDYHNQFMAYRKVCEQLGIKDGESEQGAANMLKRLKIDNATQQQKDDLAKKAVEEHQAIRYDKHCKVEFGKYVQVHEKHNNSMEPRTSGTRALHASGNEQAGHYFLSLHTGKRILRNHWMVLSMPNNVADAVH